MQASMKPGDACILLSTCARYAPVAELTARQLPIFWNQPPPVFLCGIEKAGAIPLRDDPKDWMAVTRSAVEDLQKRGFSWVYLILDDHPPIGRCNADFLNNQLPGLAARLDATHVGLLGWGQRRAREGDKPEADMEGLSRNSRTYRWKFSLHPSLWSVPRLLELLEARMSQYAGTARTPWNFERHRDVPGGAVSEKLLTSTYRVNGFQNAKPAGRTLIASKEAGLFAYDIFRFLIRKTAGQAARDRFDAEKLWLYHIYCGPYPLFWSGAVRGGKPSPEFQFFFRLMARKWMLPEWGQLDQIFPSNA
jgi:hypothetical protein